MANRVHFHGFKYGVTPSAQRLTVNKLTMEVEFIPLLVSFGYDQLTNYVKNKHLSIAVRGEEEGIFYHVFILETLTWLYYVGKNVRLFSLRIFDV